MVDPIAKEVFEASIGMLRNLMLRTLGRGYMNVLKRVNELPRTLHSKSDSGVN